ncbi:hypothetical protein GCK72_014851 [Caenorhabditis remanei]|uniref:Tyrosine-protein phosphatase domain-containing protein n=1 Tax=Caenorhabditis remanei TaxID=31234 RepID=A0A6A5GVA5_CAERE|nr:hypothetical protein GCK72_014851 [Caenorhabditis remanei]KAF1758393.1 hypothetical protein GCK72_014851 [Caenorhabditis remanei]
MDVKAVEKKRKKHKTSVQKPHGKTRDPSKVRKHKSHGTQNKKHKKRGSKSRSKSKKKSGFLCCKKKKKKRSRKSKSKTTHKQPRMKPIAPLPPVPNEQLGEVVLVGNTPKVPVTPQKQEKEPLTPEKEGVKPTTAKSAEDVKPSKEKIGSEKDEKGEKTKVDSTNGSKKDEKEKTDQKSENQENEKKKTIEVDKLLDEIEKNEIDMSALKPLGEKLLDPKSTLAVSDWNQVSGYIPNHVSKRNFLANMSKNRFADIICMDHSRVKMSDSSYIHANWVKLNDRKKAILTQFPLPNTAADFWQMLLEQKVQCVLLIMTDQEYKSFDGDSVFPKNQDFLSFEERSIRVGEFKQVEMAKGWNLKVISVTNGTSKTFIHVHHYKNWLHDSIPSESKHIWQLQYHLEKYPGPPVFMSLSGCGRAGTYALFESANFSLLKRQAVNVPKSLKNLRNGRLHSVQNVNQFSFACMMVGEQIAADGCCNRIGKDQENSITTILRQLTIQ